MATAFKHCATGDNVLHAVAARSVERAEAFAKQHDVAKAYGSYEALLKDDKISTVYVSTINSQHCQCVSDALNAGKNVLCEKPVAVNRRQWDQMKQAAKKNGKFLMDGLWSAFLPTYVHLRESIAKGELGDLRSITANFCYQEPSADSSLAEAGGTLMSIGYYLPAITTLLVRERPSKVTAVGVVPKGQSDAAFSLSLEYGGGKTVAHLTAATTFLTECPLYVIGTNSTRVIPEKFWCPTAVKASDGRDFTFSLPDVKTNYPRTVGFSYEIEHVGDCVAKGLTQSPVVSWDITDTVIDICDETRRQIGVVYPMDNE